MVWLWSRYGLDEIQPLIRNPCRLCWTWRQTMPDNNRRPPWIRAHPYRGERLVPFCRRSRSPDPPPPPLSRSRYRAGSHTESDMRINCVRWINDSSVAESYSSIIIVGHYGSRSRAYSRTYWYPGAGWMWNMLSSSLWLVDNYTRFIRK